MCTYVYSGITKFFCHQPTLWLTSSRIMSTIIFCGPKNGRNFRSIGLAYLSKIIQKMLFRRGLYWCNYLRYLFLTFLPIKNKLNFVGSSDTVARLPKATQDPEWDGPITGGYNVVEYNISFRLTRYVSVNGALNSIQYTFEIQNAFLFYINTWIKTTMSIISPFNWKNLFSVEMSCLL